MTPVKLEKSRSAGGAHHLLGRMAGAWAGEAKTWFEPGVLADTSPFEGKARTVLDGRFLHLEYRARLQGESLEGLMILGCDLGAAEWTMSWIDTFHDGTATMVSRGAAEPARAGLFEVLGSYRDPGGGPDWGWRTRIDLPAADRLEIRHWNIPPGGEAALAVEIRCRRTE